MSDLGVSAASPTVDLEDDVQESWRVASRDPETLAKQLRAWELDNGEGFTDYYMDGYVKPVSWAFWLLGKGYVIKANMLIDKITHSEYLDQDELFHIHYSDDIEWGPDQKGFDAAEAVYEKDFLIWVEFLCASDRYFKDIAEWLLTYGE